MNSLHSFTPVCSCKLSALCRHHREQPVSGAVPHIYGSIPHCARGGLQHSSLCARRLACSCLPAGRRLCVVRRQPSVVPPWGSASYIRAPTLRRPVFKFYTDLRLDAETLSVCHSQVCMLPGWRGCPVWVEAAEKAPLSDPATTVCIGCGWSRTRRALCPQLAPFNAARPAVGRAWSPPWRWSAWRASG